MIFISDLVAICCFSSPDLVIVGALDLLINKAKRLTRAGTWITRKPKPFAPFDKAQDDIPFGTAQDDITDSKESLLLWQNRSKLNSRPLF